MRRTIGVVLFVVGFVWFLLGVGLMQGSQISGQLWAAIVGGIAMVIGLFTLNAHRRPLPKDLGKKPEAAKDEDTEASA